MLGRIAAPLVAAAMMAGCVVQPSSEIKSSPTAGYTPAGKSIYVASRIADMQPDFDPYVKAAIEQKFRADGFEVSYVAANEAMTGGDKLTQQARDASANQVLLIVPTGGTKLNVFTLLLAEYEVSLIDVASNATAYKGAYRFHPLNDHVLQGIVWGEDSANGLATHIFDDLKKHKVIE